MTTTLHYNGMLAVSLSTMGGVISAGLPATVWTADTGGTQILDVIDTYGGTGGTVRSGPVGRWKFTATFPDDAVYDIVWLDFGVGERWPFRALESYGPPGPKGDPGDPGTPGTVPAGGTTDQVIVRAPGGTAWKDIFTDLGAAAAADVITANQNAAAAQETAQQALDAAGSGATIPAGGAAGASLVKASATTGDVTFKVLTPGDVGAAPAVHGHTAGQVSGLAQVATTGSYLHLTDRPAAAVPLADKGIPNGVATLDASGTVPSAQIPSLALTEARVVADQAAMLALTNVQPGDIAVRTDGAGTFILTTAPASTLGNWTHLNAPTDTVVSVNGQVGTVALSAADVGAATTAQGAKADTAVQPAGIPVKVIGPSDPDPSVAVPTLVVRTLT